MATKIILIHEATSSSVGSNSSLVPTLGVVEFAYRNVVAVSEAYLITGFRSGLAVGMILRCENIYARSRKGKSITVSR